MQFEDISGYEDDNESFELQLTDEEKEFEKNLPAFSIHTSGSTGHPKIVGQVRGVIVLCTENQSNTLTQVHKIIAGWLDSMPFANAKVACRPVYPQGPLFHVGLSLHLMTRSLIIITGNRHSHNNFLRTMRRLCLTRRIA